MSLGVSGVVWLKAWVLMTLGATFEVGIVLFSSLVVPCASISCRCRCVGPVRVLCIVRRLNSYMALVVDVCCVCLPLTI